MNFLQIEVTEIKSQNVGAIALLVIVLLIAFTGIAYADRNVPAPPEIQGLATSTGMNVQGTITETDSGAWSVNSNGIPISGNDPILANYPGWGSSVWVTYNEFLHWWNNIYAVPAVYADAGLSLPHLQDALNANIAQGGELGQSSSALLAWLQNQGSPLTPPLQDQEVQYTTGYNDALMAVSGKSIFAKTMAISTGNKIADQSNVKADTSLQFIAIDSGRATRTEDLLLDGAAQATNTSNAILCPFATSVSPAIPAYCNIEQAGSSVDTTLTSVVTSTNDRFVGTDSIFPVTLNYNINVEGLTVGSQSSPMIGSVSAYLKVHVQEARNISQIPDTTWGPGFIPAITLNPQKSEDLVYSETSSASGLVSKFSKSMSYQSGFNLI
ncbi:MAG TPA: hypothetical protein VMS89_08820 [Methanoregulaceae archaeon]|nr:hypothetical protein [Methanoregulaceae archaeon]